MNQNFYQIENENDHKIQLVMNLSTRIRFIFAV